jgi:hypothetical protein
MRGFLSDGRLMTVGGAVADQYVYSLGNFLPSVAVARATSTSSFAQFSTVFLLYAIGLGGSRASIAESLAVRAQHADDDAKILQMLGGLVRRLIWYEVAAVIVGALAVEAGLLPMSATIWIGAIALGLPFHALQDCARAVHVSRGRAGRALASDVVWLVFAVAALILPLGGDALPWISSLWSVGGVVACLLLRPPVWGRAAEEMPLWSSSYSAPSLVEYALQPAVVQLSQVLCGVAGSAAAIAALRGGGVLFRPLQLMLTAHRSLAIGAKRAGGASVLRSGLMVSVAGTVVYSAILFALPPMFGRQLLGDTWSVVRTAIIPLAAGQLFSLSSYVVVTGLKSSRQMAGLGWLRAAGVVAIPACTTAGAALAGGAGAAWGLLIGQAVGLGWMVLRTRRRQGSPDNMLVATTASSER